MLLDRKNRHFTWIYQRYAKAIKRRRQREQRISTTRISLWLGLLADVYQRLSTVVRFPILWLALALATFMTVGWVPAAAPIGTVLIGTLAIQLYEQREKQQLMALLSMNVSPGTAKMIWRHKGVILHQGELAAQKLTATVLFMDIRGFTGIAETLPSQQLLALAQSIL